MAIDGPARASNIDSTYKPLVNTTLFDYWTFRYSCYAHSLDCLLFFSPTIAESINAATHMNTTANANYI